MDPQLQEQINKEVEKQIEMRLGDIIDSSTIFFDRNMRAEDGTTLDLGRSNGFRLGGEAGQRIGFFGQTPAAQQTYPTTTGGIADVLETLGLVGSGTFPGGGSTPESIGIYHGRVDTSGSADRLPSGWTSTKDAVGEYTVTHNLGTSNYTVIPTARSGSDNIAILADVNSNDFELECYDWGSDTKEDVDFHFILITDPT